MSFTMVGVITSLNHNLEADQFDESLDRRVWSLSDQRLKWDLEIATKRRGIPSDVESLMRDILAQQREHDESHFPDRNIDMEETEEDPEGSLINVNSYITTHICLKDATEVTQELSELATELQEVGLICPKFVGIS